MPQKNTPFILFSIALVIIMVLPNLVKDGMFMDGLLYSLVAHNEAHGIGSFWYPLSGPTATDFFHEQPPLTFGIMSVFYRLMGDSIYVERFYSFLTLIFQTILIILLWRKVYNEEKELRAMFWIPLILWIMIPTCHFCFSNCMEENTMGVFCLLSIYLLWNGLEANRTSTRLLNIAIAGLFVFLASLSKGFPGLFPLAGIFIYWLVFRRFSFTRCVLYTLFITCIVVAGYALILSNQYTRHSWLTYFNSRVLNSIQHVSTDEGRFGMWRKLAVDLIIPAGIVAIVLIIAAKRKEFIRLNSYSKKLTIFFLLLGFSGSLPLIITLEQRRFYYMQTLPCFAISLAGIIAPICAAYINRINVNRKAFRYIYTFCFLFIPISLLYSAMQYGQYTREENKIKDLHVISSVIPQSSVISLNNGLCEDWSLQCYLMRLYFISSECSDGRKYYLIEKEKQQPNPAKFKLVVLPTTLYNLYEKK